MPESKYCESCGSMDIYHNCPVCGVYLCSKCPCPRHPHAFRSWMEPVLIGTSLNPYATAPNYTRKTLIDTQGYHWVFYYYGYDEETGRFPTKAYSSKDGINWKENTFIAARLESWGTNWITQTSSDSSHSVYGENIIAQTFTFNGPTGSRPSYIITYANKIGSPTGFSIVELRTVDSYGRPTSEVLSTGKTTDGFNAVPIGFYPPVELTNGVKYAFVFRAPSGDSSNYWAILTKSGNPYTGGSLFTSNNNGESWTEVSTHDVRFYFYYGSCNRISELKQTLDCVLEPSKNKFIGVIELDDTCYWLRGGFLDGILRREVIKPASMAGYFGVAPRFAQLSNYYGLVRDGFQPDTNLFRGRAYLGVDKNFSSALPTGTSESSTVNLNFHQSLTFTWEKDKGVNLIARGNGEVYWSFWGHGKFYPLTSLGFSIAGGELRHQSLVGTSARDITDFEEGPIDIVYIKNDMKLCHRRFTGSWSEEIVIEENTTARYPVLITSKGGFLLLFYFKNGKLFGRFFNNKVWSPEHEIKTKHQFNNPKWLSSNQIVQQGKINLVWTEGTEPPYSIWFATFKVGSISEYLKTPPRWLLER